MINILSAKPTKKNKSTKQRERRRSLILEMLEDRRALAALEVIATFLNPSNGYAYQLHSDS
jgi:hypothetical protein